MKFIFFLIYMIFSALNLTADWIEYQEIIPYDSEVSDYFGHSISATENFVVIGAPYDDNSEENTGSVYVYAIENDNWVFHSKLTANDASWNACFGYSVSIYADIVIVGCPFDDVNGVNSGSAYVFQKEGNSWNFLTKITPLDGDELDHFGKSVSISDNYCVIGADNDFNNNIQGSAYIFANEEDSWIEQTKLVPSTGHTNDQFGLTVSISGNFVAIGTWLSGVFIYKQENEMWSIDTQLLQYTGLTPSVCIFGDYIVIGDISDDDIAYNGGAAYIYHRIDDSWIEEEKLTPTSLSDGDSFGSSVSVVGNYLLIGAYFFEPNHNTASFYIYMRDDENWNQQFYGFHYIPDSIAIYPMTFLNVALSEDYAFVGEPYNYENNSFSGIVYVIQNSTTDIQDFIGDIQSCSFSIRNFPNPFNPITTIEFSIQNDSKIELSIYNIKGQKIKTLIQNEYLKGTHSIIWNGADESNNPVSSGIYYYKLNVNGKTEVVKKCLLLK